MIAINIEEHLAWFHEFTDTYLLENKLDPLILKVEHSKKVLENAYSIVSDNKFKPSLNLAIVLAALYHDVGRFPQYTQWKTFKDSISVNHALVGVKILKSNPILQKEDASVRSIVLGAVALHNRFAVKESLMPDLKLVTNAVRDSDKCDIIRIIAEEFSLKAKKDPVIRLNVVDDASLYTPAVLEDALAGRVASYSQLQSVNDFKILLGTWIYDLHFSTSRKFFKKSGYLKEILSELKAEAHVLRVRDKLLKDLNALS